MGGRLRWPFWFLSRPCTSFADNAHGHLTTFQRPYTTSYHFIHDWSHSRPLPIALNSSNNRGQSGTPRPSSRPLRTFQDPFPFFPDFFTTSQDLSRPSRSGKVGFQVGYVWPRLNRRAIAQLCLLMFTLTTSSSRVWPHNPCIVCGIGCPGVLSTVSLANDFILTTAWLRILNFPEKFISITTDASSIRGSFMFRRCWCWRWYWRWW